VWIGYGAKDFRFLKKRVRKCTSILLMKNDQEGTRPRDARHIYANPLLPEICPILSLAVYAAVIGLPDSKIFPGGNQYDRFSKILKRLMLEPSMAQLLENEGLHPSDIGTHSARKG